MQQDIFPEICFKLLLHLELGVAWSRVLSLNSAYLGSAVPKLPMLHTQNCSFKTRRQFAFQMRTWRRNLKVKCGSFFAVNPLRMKKELNMFPICGDYSPFWAITPSFSCIHCERIFGCIFIETKLCVQIMYIFLPPPGLHPSGFKILCVIFGFLSRLRQTK